MSFLSSPLYSSLTWIIPHYLELLTILCAIFIAKECLLSWNSWASSSRTSNCVGKLLRDISKTFSSSSRIFIMLMHFVSLGEFVAIPLIFILCNETKMFTRLRDCGDVWNSEVVQTSSFVASNLVFILVTGLWYLVPKLIFQL